MKVKDIAIAARHLKTGPDDGLEEGQFSAYAAVFDNVDSYGEVIVKGAFANDLERWKESGQNLPLLFGHQMSDPDFNLGHVVEAAEDDRGLKVTGQLDLTNPKALQVYKMLKGKRVNQMSFAYDVLDGTEVTGDLGEYFELRELKLYEVSVVTIGANQETEILAVKSAAGALLAKAGRVLSARNEKALRSAHESLVGAADEINNLLTAIDGGEGKSATADEEDQNRASGTPEPVTADASDAPEVVASLVSAEPVKADPSVRLAAHVNFLASVHAGGKGGPSCL